MAMVTVLVAVYGGSLKAKTTSRVAQNQMTSYTKREVSYTKRQVV